MIANRRATGRSAAYESWLRYMLRFLIDAHETLPTSPEPLEALLASLREPRPRAPEGLSDSSRKNVWAALRMLYRFAGERFGAVDAMATIHQPSIRTKLMRTLSEAQMQRLLWVARKRGPRDYALIRVLLDAALRVGEAARLRWDDLLFDNDGERVWYGLAVPDEGKTGGSEVPILPETYDAIRRLPATGRPELWLNKRTGEPLTFSGVQVTVRRLMAAAGCGGGPHTLRHTFARLYLLKGGDPVSLQRIMRHRNFATTRKYVDLYLGDVRRQHARYSPLADYADGGSTPRG